MSDLTNSARQVNKVTHVQLRNIYDHEKREPGKKVPAGRAFDKLNYLRSLGASKSELSGVRDHMRSARKRRRIELPEAILSVAAELAEVTGRRGSLSQARTLSHVTPGALKAFGLELAALRRNEENMVEQVRKELVQSYQMHLTDSRGEDGFQNQKSRIFRSPLPLLRRRKRGSSGIRLYSREDSLLGKEKELYNRLGQAAYDSEAEFRAALTWAQQNKHPRLRDLEVQGYATDLLAQRGPGRGTETVVDSFEERMHIEPVGRLHLERLTMTPAGIEKGELLYSLPLAPKEVANISHKEWSTSSDEFEKIVQDTFEEYSETGVAEKKDLSQATDSQQKHSTAYSLSGSYSYAGTANVNFGYDRSSDDQESEKISRKTSSELTRKASKRATSDHKYSFKVESAYGSEDQTVRKIENPSESNVLRLDYYQMIRKWRVDLYRYDVRLTYDLVIPSPGAALLRKLVEIRDLQEKIDAPFSFPLDPATIDASNWQEIAAAIGGRVDPPPLATPFLHKVTIPYVSQPESRPWVVQSIDIPIGSDFKVESGSFRAQFGRHNDYDVSFYLTGEAFEPRYVRKADGSFELNGNGDRILAGIVSELENMVGESGDLQIVCNYRWVSHGSMNIRLDRAVTTEALERWQYTTWHSLRNSAEEQYFQAKQSLTERLERLQAELDSWDALTLRGLEREAIMRGVLQWMMGPDFDFGTPGITSDLGSEVSPDSSNWEAALEYGQFTKFLHHAVEWENVLYFLYPHFWDQPEASRFKLFLRHPDPRHREFLRAGSARVVLTIRPGFEREFTNLLETAEWTEDPGNPSPYLPIAEEIQNFAKTNYPGIPPANPIENYRTLLTPQQKAAWRDQQRLIMLLERVQAATGSYPDENTWFNAVSAEATALQADSQLDPWNVPWDAQTLPANDPWGRPWIYHRPGTFSDYDLATYGADGLVGGQGDDGDITSWAEASLIGRWFEYTPTSALDMSTNTNWSELA